MRKSDKVKWEIRRHKFLDILSEVVYGEGHPLDMRFLAAKKMLQVYAADREDLPVILKKYKNLLNE